ncbi:flagellar protein FliT [Cedecea sp.]|jgi:flagellar protein FliT|uniref:flagellar protein FliT n=1 Tax=Cedecea sp. TaxID=1970739 RepID=UPI0012AEA79C|nr:flagellar protein FliT [Enterobacteriaceae bacterium RIT693]
MADVIASKLQQISELNRALLEFTHRGEWDAFIETMTEYVVQVEALTTLDTGALSSSEHEKLKQHLALLLENEALMVERMRGRLDILRKEMSSINKGKAASHAYLSPFTSVPR